MKKVFSRSPLEIFPSSLIGHNSTTWPQKWNHHMQLSLMKIHFGLSGNRSSSLSHGCQERVEGGQGWGLGSEWFL